MIERREYTKWEDKGYKETIFITEQPVAVPYADKSIKVGMQESVTTNFFDKDKAEVLKVLMKNQIDALSSEISNYELRLMSVLDVEDKAEVIIMKIGELTDALKELNENLPKLDKKKKGMVIQELAARVEKTRNEIFSIATLSKNLQLHKDMLERKKKEYDGFCAIVL